LSNQKKNKVKIPLSEKILLLFFIFFCCCAIFFYLVISNKCFFINNFNINDLEINKNSKIIIIEAPCGKVAIKIFSELAPINTNRIIKLINEKHYDNSAFYKVKKNTLIETGDLIYGKKNNLNYLKVGSGGSKLSNNKTELVIDYEFKRGSIGMVRKGQFDTENSQFFILLKDMPSLNGQFTPIGEVILGLDVLDKIKYNNTSEYVLRPDFIEKAYVYDPN